MVHGKIRVCSLAFSPETKAEAREIFGREKAFVYGKLTCK